MTDGEKMVWAAAFVASLNERSRKVEVTPDQASSEAEDAVLELRDLVTQEKALAESYAADNMSYRQASHFLLAREMSEKDK
jgi:hypothetical protein